MQLRKTFTMLCKTQNYQKIVSFLETPSIADAIELCDLHFMIDSFSNLYR